MNNYQIKLTPVNAYFFGGEKHSAKKKEPGKFEMDYYVQSELYPQQTTLLGALRYYLLMKNNLLSPAKDGKTAQANELIGEKSFLYGFIDDKGVTEQNFATIKSISPLYFQKEDIYFSGQEQKYIVAPFDYEFELVSHYGNYQMKGYKAKEGYNPKLINLKDNSTFKFFKDDKDENDTDFVFIKHETVGNKKGDKGKSEDDGFYKQVMYKLNKGWSFAFDIETNCDLSNDKQFITIGAEQQLFVFEVNDCANNITNFQLDLRPRLKPAIYCISDCFVNEKIWEHTIFAINENVSFRNLQSSNSSKNYSSFSKGYSRGNRYNLLKRGSVLYFQNESEMKKAQNLFNNKNAENIGFNNIQTI